MWGQQRPWAQQTPSYIQRLHTHPVRHFLVQVSHKDDMLALPASAALATLGLALGSAGRRLGLGLGFGFGLGDEGLQMRNAFANETKCHSSLALSFTVAYQAIEAMKG